MNNFLTQLSLKRGMIAAALAFGVSFAGVSQSVERAPQAPLGNQDNRTFQLSTLDANAAPANLVEPKDLNMTEAQWDVQFNYNLNTATSAPVVAFAGVVYTGTEFWVSGWRSDTVFRLNPNGTVIGQVTTLNRANNAKLRQIRGMAWDGTSIWAANASNKLFKINPTTQTVIDSVTLQGSVTARFVAYDPTVNNGAGGFHIGNFTSAYNTLSLTGTLLQSVPAATHGVVGAYGGAADNISAGGPYLWLFAQEGTPSNNVIKAVRLPSMAPTSLLRDVTTDITVAGTSVAGGAFIASGIIPGKNTVGGIVQDSPNRLFGYELDIVPINVDAVLRSANTTNRYTQVPFDQLTPLSFSGNVFNAGSQALTAVKAKVELIDLSNLATVFTDSATVSNLASGAAANFTTGAYTVPAIKDYGYVTYLNTGAQADQVATNDTLIGFFSTDSTFARDNGQLAGRLGFGDDEGGIIGQTYTTTQTKQMTSVTVAFIDPPVGQTVNAYVYTMGSGANPVPAAQVFTSAPYTFTAADSNVVVIDFKFDNVFLPPSTWFFGIDEKTGGENVSIAYTEGIFTEATGFIQFAGSGTWARTEQVGFAVTYVVRPNFNYCLSLAATAATTPDNGTANGTATVTVSGGFPPFTYAWNDPLAQSTPSATGLTSGRPYTVRITDSRGCALVVTTDSLDSNVSIDRELAAGISTFELYPNPARTNTQLNIELAQPDAVSVRMFDAAGKMVYNRNLGTTTSFSEIVSFESLAPGAYNLQITTSKGSASKRLILE